MNDPTPELSVVVVSRNEADRIEACLESVLATCRGGPPFEVIVVDSNSTDGSAELAAAFPATVLRIPSDDLCTPGAGRHVGAERARGDYLLFVDGDMALRQGWLGDALAHVRRSGVAGVTGRLNEPGGASTPREVDVLRGVALYDAAALYAVGGFDPFLQASEDRDLGFRLVDAGYRLLELPAVVADHPSEATAGEPLRRWRNGYYHGVGQAVRKATGRPTLVGRHLQALRHPLLAGAWLLLGATAVGCGARPFAGWTAASVGGFALAARRGGLARTAMFAVTFLLTLAGLVLGYRCPPPAPGEFPLDAVAVVSESDAVLGA